MINSPERIPFAKSLFKASLSKVVMPIKGILRPRYDPASSISAKASPTYFMMPLWAQMDAKISRR